MNSLKKDEIKEKLRTTLIPFVREFWEDVDIKSLRQIKDILIEINNEVDCEIAEVKDELLILRSYFIAKVLDILVNKEYVILAMNFTEVASSHAIIRTDQEILKRELEDILLGFQERDDPKLMRAILKWDITIHQSSSLMIYPKIQREQS